MTQLSKIMIGKQKVDVEYFHSVDEWSHLFQDDDIKVMGLFDPVNLRITVLDSPDAPVIQKLSHLLHETIHAYIHQYGMLRGENEVTLEEENLVIMCESLMMNIIRDNPELIEEIMENVET